ncbi:hypothetical protein [Aeromonas media]|uniref:hypothetical protein n=1 Tax=Aeromonas media TaxID=651 RepID=UPI003D1E4A26
MKKIASLLLSLTLLSTQIHAQDVEYLDPLNTAYLHRLEQCIKVAYGQPDLMKAMNQCQRVLPVEKRRPYVDCITMVDEATANFEAFRLSIPWCVDETFGIE